MFKKPYQYNLRKLQLEQSNSGKQEDTTSISTDLFNNSVFDLSDEDVYSIALVVMYRSHFAKLKHSYKLEPLSTVSDSKHENSFVLVESILPSLIPDCDAVDGDFLTGYYLVACHMNLPYALTSFHAGMTKDMLTKGIYYALLKKEKKTKWQMLGCDAVSDNKYKKVMYNGVKMPCDIYCANTTTSINIQLNENIALESINLYTCDIVSKTTADVVKQLLLIRGYLTADAYILLRLPLDWKNIYTSMTTFLLFCVSNYKIVKLIKTPWGDSSKLYLLLHSRKINILQPIYMSLNSYVNDLYNNADLPLINQNYFNEHNQESILKNIHQSYINICSKQTYSEETALQLWTKLVE